MNMPLIRLATDNDLPFILALYAQPSFNGQAVDLQTAHGLMKRLEQHPNYFVYVAEDRGQVVGSLCLIVFDNIAAMGRRSAIIESVVVDETHRGDGCGTAMLKIAMQKASDLGAYKIALYTSSPDDEVHHFYEKLGFERHGISYLLPAKDQAQ